MYINYLHTKKTTLSLCTFALLTGSNVGSADKHIQSRLLCVPVTEKL